MKSRILVPFLVLSVAVVGCGSGSDGDGLTKEQTVSADRTQSIISASHGSWDQVPAEDKQYLIQQANGNEAGARRRFEMMSSRIAGTASPMANRPGPGGPPPQPR